MAKDKIRIDSTSLSFFIDGKTYYVTMPSDNIDAQSVEKLKDIVKYLHSLEINSITTRGRKDGN